MRILYKSRPGSADVEMNDVIALPAEIPGLGVKAGDAATVDSVHGGMMRVIVDRSDGATVGFAQMEKDENDNWGVVAYRRAS